MKKTSIMLLLSFMICLTACGAKEDQKKDTEIKEEVSADLSEEAEQEQDDVITIELSNSSILVECEEISDNPEDAVYKANDIIFYLEDQGIEYGEGTEEDAHSQIEADAHTVVHITKPGTYEISGKMEAGQIFVDLGEDAKEDPEAVVNLILNDADITCTVAPAIFFYQVYECGDKEEENASMEVDLSNAGANLILADDSKNTVYGSYVARIYESCELNEEGTEVVDSKKLHKYDAAVYSKMSMNILGDTGSLSIKAENEGLDTELHMNIEGGKISIESGNDGINVNEDNISVFTMNGGTLDIVVSGETGEGDGIDSNGWLVINGGTVTTSSCAVSEDAGIDADLGIYINGGTVAASGNMNAEIADGAQASVSFMARESMEGGKKYTVKDSAENTVMEISPKNTFRMLSVSFENISEEESYSLWLGDEQVAAGMSGTGMRPGGFGNGMERPEGMEPPEGMEMPEGMEPPEGADMNGEMKRPMGGEMPEGMERPERMENPES